MVKGFVFGQFAQKVRVPADIVHITFPVLCWALVVLRWSNLWLTAPWMTAVIVFYYVLAAAYLFFTFFTRMRVISIVGLFLVLFSCLFLWVPYNWVLAVLLTPAMYMAFYNRGKKYTACALAILTGLCVLIIIVAISLPLKCLEPEKYAYYPSPDGRHVALEHTHQWLFFGGTDVRLCRASGPLLISERILYLADHDDFGGRIEWLDQNTILIYGEKMDAFNNPTIHNYTPF